MSDEVSESDVSVGCSTLCMLITIIFVILKLTGCITWPWLACFIPVMICPGIAIAILVIFLALIAAILLIIGTLIIVLAIPTMISVGIYKMFKG